MPKTNFICHGFHPSLSASKILIPRTPVPRHISDIIILQHRQNLVRQRAHDLDCVDARQVRAQALPLGDPGGGGVANGDKRVEDSRRAFGDGVGRVLQLQEAGTDEFLNWGGGIVSVLEGRWERGEGEGRSRRRGRDWERTVVVLTMEHTIQARRLREEDIRGELQSSDLIQRRQRVEFNLDQRALVRILYSCGP
jgi:hypothetical protein